MGIIADSIPALIARSVNNRRNHINRVLFDIICTRNVIVCGGNDIDQDRRGREILTLSGEFKINTCIQAVQNALSSHKSAVLFFDQDYYPNIDTSFLYSQFQDNICVMGEDCTYEPLSTLDYNTSEDDIVQFFDRVLNYYYKGNNSSSYEDSMSICKMIVNILASIGSDYITIENINSIANDLFKNSEITFKNIIEAQAPFSSKWNDFITFEWENAKSRFHSFWHSFMNGLGKFKCSGQKGSNSLYGMLYNRNSANVCIFPLRNSDGLLKNIILSEIEMIYGKIPIFDFIDYHVALPTSRDYSFLERIRPCIIGNSLHKLGIERLPFQDPTLVCLGVNAQDAEDILNSMVSTGHWIRENIGYGFRPRHLHVGFAGAEIKPITSSDLSFSNIPEGSAFRIDDRGYTYISNLFV